MDRLLIWLILVTFLITTSLNEVNSQSYYDDEDEYEELTLTNRENTLMMIFGELSYGTLGLGVTAGF